MRRLFAMGSVLVLLLAACTPSGPAGGSRGSETPAPQGSAAGTYVPGTEVVLASGASLRVPDGWTMQLHTRGALVTPSPAAGGATTFESSNECWGAGGLRVFQERSAYDAAIAVARHASTQATDTGDSVIVPVSWARGQDASATAYMSLLPGKARQRCVDMFVEVPGQPPVEFTLAVTQPPPGSKDATPGELPALLLDYFRFSPM